MSKRPSLTYQIQQILKPMFERGFGRGRHEDKMNALHLEERIDTYTKKNIYAGNTYRSNLQKCNTIYKFCKEEYGLRYIHEIKPDHFNEFIRRGSQNCGAYSFVTAEQYKNALEKLQTGYNLSCRTDHKFYDNSYRECTVDQAKQREQMPREVHDAIIEKVTENKPENGHAFSLARACGLRVGEIPEIRIKDFKVDPTGKVKSLHIHKSKGGRSRDILVERLDPRYKDSVQQVYDYYKDSKGQMDRLFTQKTDSLSKTFARNRDAFTGDEYKQCGFHSMRKEFAKDYIINRAWERGVTLTEKDDLINRATPDELRELSECLGHNRIDFLNSYLR